MARLPGRKDRTAEIGSTGSGKSHFGMYHLARKNLREEIWIYIDYKNDDEEIINQIRGVKHIEIGDVPKKPGLYVVHPLPRQIKEMESYYWKIWERRRVGLYVDEGYMVGDSEAFEAILTQGRSLLIPVFVGTQRPRYVTRFVFSESQFIQVFSLNDEDDWKRVTEFMPREVLQIYKTLKPFHSLYFDVKARELSVFAPAPGKKEIISMVERQLMTKMI